MSRGLTVLMYHRVLPDEQCDGYPFDTLAMPASAFRRQVEWLAGHRRVTTVARALDAWGDGEPCVCLTFDDGYEDNFRVAAPILEEFGLLGTFYVTVGLIGGADLLWFDRAALLWNRRTAAERRDLVRDLFAEGSNEETFPSTLRGWVAELKRRPPDQRARILEAMGQLGPNDEESRLYRLMDVDQLVALARRGHELGSHTMTHCLLPQLEEAEIRQELEDSRHTLQDWIGSEVPGICYPNGDHDERVVAIASRAGYRYGCTTREGINLPGFDRMRILRLDMKADRVTAGGRHDETAFRAEVSLFHKVWR